MRDRNSHACAEPLERRSLLSAAVRAVEFEGPGDDDDMEIAASALPPTIVASLRAQYPNANLIEASFGNDDGPEFEVTLQSRGREIELTFNPRGEIIGMEQVLAPGELPSAVIDWVRQNFPQARIQEPTVASDAGIVSYGVLIVTADGRELDTTLWLADAESNAAPIAGERTPEQLNRPALEAPAIPPGVWLSSSQQLDEVSQEHEMLHASATAPLPSRDGEQTIARESDPIDPPPADQSRPTAISIVLADIFSAGPGLAGALQASAAGAAPFQWTPQISGLLNDVLPANLLSIERGFAEIFQRVDALAEKVAVETMQSSFATKMTVASLLVAAALLLRHPKKAKSRPLLVNAANSSWSWVFGTSAKK